MNPAHAAIACLALSTMLPAMARADCAAVARAMLAVADQPGVHQRTLDGAGAKPRIVMEALSLPDAMYISEGGKPNWLRTGMDTKRRRDIARKALETLPLSDCAGPRETMDGGTPVQAYDYTQPNPLMAGQKTRATIWIGKTDGLPRRLLLPGGEYQTFEYGAFATPQP